DAGVAEPLLHNLRVDVRHQQMSRVRMSQVVQSAQLFLERGRNTYTEVTPSGTGCRIWGLANGGPLHRKFTLKAGSKEFEPDKIIHAELFRRTRKALIPVPLDQNPCAHWRSPMDIMRQG